MPLRVGTYTQEIAPILTRWSRRRKHLVPCLACCWPNKGSVDMTSLVKMCFFLKLYYVHVQHLPYCGCKCSISGDQGRCTNLHPDTEPQQGQVSGAAKAEVKREHPNRVNSSSHGRSRAKARQLGRPGGPRAGSGAGGT